MRSRQEKIEYILRFWRSQTLLGKLKMWISNPLYAMHISALDKADKKATAEMQKRVFNRHS